MTKERKAVIAGNEISKLETYTLGGYEQKVLIEGKSIHNPIMIFFHGGPGLPVPFSEGCRGMFPQFTDRFIMVYWDQLGCGINNHRIDNNFHIRDFVDMTVDLITIIHQQFPNNKLILFGISWGTVLVAKATALLPEMVDQVLVYGQMVKNIFFNQEVYSALLQAEMPEHNKAWLTEIMKKDFPEPKDILQIRDLIRKYTEGYHSKSKDELPVYPLIHGLLGSPDYKIKDFLAVNKNGYQYNTSLWQELIHLDISSSLENTQTPYLIIQGSTDIVASAKNIEKFVEEGTNPLIRLLIAENNGHIPGHSGMKLVLKESLKLI